MTSVRKERRAGNRAIALIKHKSTRETPAIREGASYVYVTHLSTEQLSARVVRGANRTAAAISAITIARAIQTCRFATSSLT